jgi:hypothetical protein
MKLKPLRNQLTLIRLPAVALDELDGFEVGPSVPLPVTMTGETLRIAWDESGRANGQRNRENAPRATRTILASK